MQNADTASQSDPLAVPTNVRWIIFFLACATSFLLYVHRYSWNLIAPQLQAEYDFSNAQIALLFSLFYSTYACGQIPSGVFIDRFGPHRFLTVIVAAWSLALVTIAHTTQLALLAGARLLFGATQAGCYPALNKLTREWFPLRQRTMLQAWIATASGRAGGAMSQVLLGTILMGTFGLGWRFSVTLLGLLGIALCIPLALWLSNSPQRDARVNEAERDLIRDGGQTSTESDKKLFLPVRQALRNTSLRWFTVQQFMDAGSDVVFLSLTGSYFLAAHKLDIKDTGWLAALPLLGGAVGGVIGGFLNDLLIRRTGQRRWARSGVGSVGKVIGSLMLVLLPFQENGLDAALLLMLAKFFGDWSQPTTWGTCTDLGGRFSATVFSIINTSGTIAGMVMPSVYGHVLDWNSTKAIVEGVEITTIDWAPLFFLLAAMYCCSAACWLVVDCTKTIRE